MGRALDCFVQLSGTERDEFISRHHCRLNVDPPWVQVGDLGSSNGTFVNGARVDAIPRDQAALPDCETPGTAVKDGDFITMGGTSFRVDVVDCPHATENAAGKPTWEFGQTARRDCPECC
jgi:pSer/pThr/pTyr-binding forkhead associated (FHA) protein